MLRFLDLTPDYVGATNLFARVRNKVTGEWWNQTLDSGAFEAWNSSHYVAYLFAAAALSGVASFEIDLPDALEAYIIDLVIVKNIDGTLANDSVIETIEDISDVGGKVRGGGSSSILGTGAQVSVASGGTGTYPLNQDGGTGAAGALITVNGVNSTTDCLRYLDPSNNPVVGLTLRAYLKSDFDNNAKNILGTQTTGSDGRWLGPIFLNSGTYYLIADTVGDNFTANQATIVVP